MQAWMGTREIEEKIAYRDGLPLIAVHQDVDFGDSDVVLKAGAVLVDVVVLCDGVSTSINVVRKPDNHL